MQYKNNLKWLLWFAPFRVLSLSAAYLVPFFQLHHLSNWQFFLVQAVFMVVVVLWEVPSGFIADRLGRAFCIKLSAPIAAVAMIAYGFSSELWQFVVWEIVLGIANGLISGADSALLYDSLRASGESPAAFEKATKHINALGFVSAVVGLPLAMWLVHSYGVASTLVADGISAAVGIVFVLRLVEAPVHVDQTATAEPKTWQSAWRHVVALFSHKRSRLLVLLTVALGAGTYMGAWFSAQTYEQLGIPLALYAAVLAGRQLWKAGWSSMYHPSNHFGWHMAAYAALLALGFVGMASFMWPLALLMLGHDVVHALQAPAVFARLNQHMSCQQRAMLNSAVNMVQRLAYALVGVLGGLLADKLGLRTALLLIGAVCMAAAVYALVGLRRAA